jgi:glycosyltransferase involved in cell wall biosynthesis
MTSTVDIVLSVHNGSRYLAEQIRSLQAQTYQAWRLWIRDDGSTDDSYGIACRSAAEDPRVHAHAPDGTRLGLPRCQGWLLERLPEDAERVFCCDADDVWLPHKIERSLRALDEVERTSPGPVLIHTDLIVVDEALRPIAPSFWIYTGVDPEPVSLRRVLVANVATWPTVLVNRPLLDLALPVPTGSPEHDWWLTLVAAVFGKVVAVRESTVLYRRHGANAYATLNGPVRSVADGLGRLGSGRVRAESLRRWVVATADQAGAFLTRFEGQLPEDHVQVLEDLSSIPRHGVLGRKLRVMRHHALAERGFIRNLALLLRA